MPHRQTLRTLIALGALGLTAWSCNNSEASGPSGNPWVVMGGATPARTGGVAGSGTADTATGTAGVTGPSTGAGGVRGSGGTTATGGVRSSGGSGGTRRTTTSVGGAPGVGGIAASGGSRASGGTAGGAGTAADGGSRASGGTAGAGGMAASGGTRARGGTTGAGGIAASGGTRASGGTTGTGGVVASGGSTSGGDNQPTLGVHAQAFTLDGKVPADVLSSPAVDTQQSGSTIVVAVARGNVNNFKRPPTDNQGNAPYALVGSVHAYSLWPNSGTAVYAFSGASGGAGHVVSITDTSSSETTVFVVEVKNAGRIQDAKFKEVLAGATLTSAAVTTTGPATLLTVCWGDAGGSPTTFTVEDGFRVIEEQPLSQISVEGAVAWKDVAAAGTYTVTWTATQKPTVPGSTMGGLMYLLALEP